MEEYHRRTIAAADPADRAPAVHAQLEPPQLVPASGSVMAENSGSAIGRDDKGRPSQPHFRTVNGRGNPSYPVLAAAPRASQPGNAAAELDADRGEVADGAT